MSVFRVLLVEDSDDDALLAKEGFELLEYSTEVHHVFDGDDCLKFLRRQSPYEDAEEPHLILLDLNLPGMSGREVLTEIVGDPALKHHRVVVLTTSNRPEDVRECYALRCNAYLRKPLDFGDFASLIEDNSRYWFGVVGFPD